MTSVLLSTIIFCSFIPLVKSFGWLEAQMECGSTPRWFDDVKGSRLMNHIIIEFQAHSYSHCFVTCLQYKEKCKSFNFQHTNNPHKTHKCELNDATAKEDPQSLREELGFTYYEEREENDLPLLEDGSWSGWSTWSPCGATCGRAERTRTRLCTNPPPLNGGKDCNGMSTQTEICEIQLFPAPVCATVITGSSSVFVEEGQTAILICNATGRPNVTTTWTKSSGNITDKNWLHEGRKLKLSNITLAESGTYICEAKDIVSTETTEANVTVVPFPKFIVTPRSRVTVPSGSRIQLDCKGTSFSNVTWKRKSGDLPVSQILYSNGTFVLFNVTIKSSGDFVCVVRSIFRSIETTTQVEVHHRSCSHVKAADPSAVSGNYTISPKGEGGREAFAVYCDMEDKDEVGVTVVGHDSEERGHVTDCDQPGCFKRNITYTGVTLAQLASLTRVTLHCEQFIMFECNNDVVFFDRFNGEIYGWWVSRDGVKMFYWGGATPGSEKCACGMTNTCIDGGGCNCNNKNNKWRNDSGLLTDKFSLPVTQLRFGDVADAHEEGYYTLGKFKCYEVLMNAAPYEHVGCYLDKKEDRALTEMLLGTVPTVKRCYELAKDKGYPAFGVQAKKECWSSKNATLTYGKHGKKDNCKDGRGGSWANDVYILYGNNGANVP